MSDLIPRGDAIDSAVIRRAQLDAEHLVALLRIGVALGLFATLFLAVGELPSDGRSHVIRQVLLAGMTLAGYLLLGLLSIWLLHRGWFQTWMIWVVATIDCGFMVLNSALSVMNTGFGGKLAFAMPSVWLVPIVLAFAVLRFNPAVQIYSVVLVVLGLGALQFLPGVAGQNGPTMERVAVAMELPPNMVRLAMIALAGGVLVVAALRMRDLLRRSIEEAQKRANLTRYLPAQVAGDLAVLDPNALRQGRDRQAAVLFVDIRDFTTWSEGRDPEEVGRFITDFRRHVEAAVKRHGGIVDKYIGDAALVFFEDEGAAERGLNCGAALLEAMSQWSKDRASRGETLVKIGVGLHYGQVFVGVVGTRDRLEYTVLGDTVNVAARIQEMCKTTGEPFLVSDSALTAAFGPAETGAPAREAWAALPGQLLRGRAGAVALFARDTGATGDDQG
ncbi:adenylate/guanylate cyclase domain-containing protein [Epibacterium sp. SM1979]|uniref:Adenylate/guanylate cyclase domain-containing protein n=1 Tax=Tritonibacter litoralis TaxID=2662264 RepID=A0A843YEH6_9RHOB|nr:adenylate/guanylate cyclase domain-containing protein [Tritonibacter litoralis]MQQ08075.1 adenylate/guanylate cyclase domain-containing protein [Tritonibacter litoralis]